MPISRPDVKKKGLPVPIFCRWFDGKKRVSPKVKSHYIGILLKKHIPPAFILHREVLFLLPAISYVQRHDSFDGLARPDLRKIRRRECLGGPVTIILNIDLVRLIALDETRDD